MDECASSLDIVNRPMKPVFAGVKLLQTAGHGQGVRLVAYGGCALCSFVAIGVAPFPASRSIFPSA